MGQQDHVGALESQDPPALEEVAVVADRGADGAEAEVVHAPLVGLAEAEELVVGGVHLPLEPDQAVRPDERRRVVVRAAEELAESVRDDDPALPRLLLDRAEDAAVMRLREPGDLGAAVVPGGRRLREHDEIAARLGRFRDQAKVRLEVVVDIRVSHVDLSGGDLAALHGQSSSERSASRATTTTLSPCSVVAIARTTQTIPSVLLRITSGARSGRSRK